MNKNQTLDFDFEIKAEDVKDDGSFTGYASMFGGKPDSYGDIIMPGAYAKTLREGGRNGNGIALLWQHKSDTPIGIWVELVEDQRGLKVKGQLALDVPFAKDVHTLLKMGAIKGMSIGFTFFSKDDWEWKDESKNIRLIKQVNLWEISLVTFPASTRAKVLSVKQFEDCNTERDFEAVLRDANLSSNAAKYIVSLCKGKFREERTSVLNDLLKSVQSVK